LPSRIRARWLAFLGSKQGQFARIEPVTRATRAVVHLDAPFGAKEMAAQFYPRAPRAFALAGRIHNQGLVTPDMQQGLAGCLAILVHLLQFEGIEPNPAATVLADIHGQVADLERGQFIPTSWAFHRLAFL